MSPYYPKSRIIENQTANPGQFRTADGKDYTGPYYTTFDGKSFTGANPYALNSVSLTSFPTEKTDTSSTSTLDSIAYNRIKPSSIQARLIDPTPFTPSPTPADYKAGKITRYLARQRNGTTFKIMEISQQTYTDLTTNSNGSNFALWKAISIFWQISGPLRNERINNITTRAGIIDTNQRILDNAEKNFIGIKQYLSNLQQFAKVS
ncbi:hypothetical protein N9795_01120 [Candidatus Pelagibacter sp.]|nr:hypothetical protein [Candidatus Pelagibacter sp.]